MPDDSSYIFDVSEPLGDTNRNLTDRFSDIKLLYESSNSPVRLHTATRYGRRYILKSLNGGWVQTDLNSAQAPQETLYHTALRKEFEIGIGLEHPNIRRTIGFEQVDGIGDAIVMEYIDGLSLEEAIAQRRITNENIREICIGIAKGLEYLHSKQVIHRDLKPSNILLTHGGNVVKIIDFSLADGGDYTIIKMPGGTRGWMAPEQQRADAVATVEGDIYSFGRIMADMVKSAGGDAPLERLAARCCNADPERRPHSVSQLRLTDLPRPSKHSWLASPWLTLGLTLIAAILLLINGGWV